MRIVDCHVHTDGAVEPSDVLRAMDANGVERCLVMSGCERESLEMSKQRLLETHLSLAAAACGAGPAASRRIKSFT